MNQALEGIKTMIHAGRLDEAERNLRGATAATDEDKVFKLHLEGRLAEEHNEWEKAAEKYRAVLAIDEDHTETLFRYACLLDLHGDDEEAFEHYERCVQERPANVNAMMNLAVLYEDHGRYEEAYDLVKAVADEHPNNVRANLFLKDIESALTMYYDEDRERSREKRDALLDTSISEFELSVRSRNCLKQMEIQTLGDLLKVSEQKLLAYKNFGDTSLNEIKAMLSQKGLRLGQGVDEPAPPAGPAAGPAPVFVGDPNLLNRSVAEMELSVRSRKCLQRLGIGTLADLTQRSDAELLSIKNFGQTSLNEIKRRLTELGLSLRGASK